MILNYSNALELKGNESSSFLEIGFDVNNVVFVSAVNWNYEIWCDMDFSNYPIDGQVRYPCADFLR